MLPWFFQFFDGKRIQKAESHTSVLRDVSDQDSACEIGSDFDFECLADLKVAQPMNNEKKVVGPKPKKKCPITFMDKEKETCEISVEESLELHRKAIEFDPTDWKNHFELGHLLLENNLDLDKAQEHFIWAIALSSRRTEPYISLAWLYKEKGQYKNAIHIYRKAIDADASNPDLYNGLGSVYEAAGEVREAIKAYHNSITLDPQLEVPYFCLGNLYYQQAQLEQALNMYLRCLKIQPNSIAEDVCFNVAIVYRRSGDEHNARKYFSMASRLESRNKKNTFHLPSFVNSGQGRTNSDQIRTHQVSFVKMQASTLRRTSSAPLTSTHRRAISVPLTLRGLY